MKSKALSFCFLGLTTVEAAINVLVSGYYGGSAQRTMIKVAETLAKDLDSDSGTPKFNVTLMLNQDTPVKETERMALVRLPFYDAEMTIDPFSSDSEGT
jgi:hypothetical protein